MKLILTTKIRKKEFKPLKRVFDLQTLKNAARKALKGLGNTIRGCNLEDEELIKIYLTAPGGAGRVIFLVEIVDNNAVLLLLRHKNDKSIGQNMSSSNHLFKQVIQERIKDAYEDVNKDAYESYEL